jgi:hypothetical protein
LNFIYEAGTASKKQLFETMQTFVTLTELDTIIYYLLSSGWLIQHENQDDSFQLSAEGKTKHQLILESQKEVRKHATQGISEEEYTTVLNVLQRIVENLEGKNT